MPTMCLQCAMRAMLDGDAIPTFDETSEEHLRRVHPDPIATKAERLELEQRLAEKMKDYRL